MAWRIKVDSVAVPRAMYEYVDQNGNKKYHHVSTVYAKGQVVPDELVSPMIQKLYEDGDEHTKSVYEKVDNEVQEHLPPSEGYDDLDESEVRASMVNMPSEYIERLKDYERAHENRESIVNYVTGHGESPTDRLEGTVPGQSGYQEPTGVDSAKEAIKPKSSSAAKEEIKPNAEASAPEEETKEEPAKAQKRTSVKTKQSSEE